MVDLSNTLLANIEDKKVFPTKKLIQQILINFPNLGMSAKQFIERLAFLPEKVQRGLAESRLQLVTTQIYKYALLEGTQIDVFKEDDSLATGISNISDSLIDNERPMLLNEIQLLYAAHATNAIENFDSEEYDLNLKRAEWAFRYDSTDVYDKMPIATTFDSGLDGYKSDMPYGVYKLDSPKMLLGGKRIEFNIKLPKAIPGTDSHAVLVALKGVTVRSFSKS